MALLGPLGAQDASPVAGGASATEPGEAAVLTRPDARTMTLEIPAPRGLITDRKGRPLAENRVGYQFAIQFEHFPDPVDAEPARNAA